MIFNVMCAWAGNQDQIYYIVSAKVMKHHQGMTLNQTIFQG